MDLYDNGYVGIDALEIENIVSKLRFFNASLVDVSLNLRDAFNDIKNNYDSDKLSSIISIQDEISNKMSIINKNCESNLNVLRKIKDSSIDLALKNTNMLRDGMGD